MPTEAPITLYLDKNIVVLQNGIGTLNVFLAALAQAK
jgi:hypothetical protein